VIVKLADLVQCYSGDSDFAEWIKKVELVAKLQGVTDISKFLPLFLTGGTFAVYENLPANVQGDVGKLHCYRRFPPIPFQPLKNSQHGVFCQMRQWMFTWQI
jgi:hypothetical protein